VYSPRYAVNVGAHVFPTAKYRHVASRLRDQGLVPPGGVLEPAAASWDDLALVHTAEYLRKLRSGALSIGEVAQLELPWSPEIVEGFRLMVGGTIAAARLARTHGLAVHLGGGLHHAYPDHGEGFCVFNDVAVAVRVLQRDGAIRRAAVVDLDVHHGNGTAAVFAGDPDVFTFSMHQEHNYPALKPPGSLDIGLRDGAGDAEYLTVLEAALPLVVAFAPDLIIYLAGADPYLDDQLGGLALSLDGLRRRDALVFRTARRAGLPVALTLAGGYARHVEHTVAIHQATVEEAFAAHLSDPLPG
jgi:acetoin utilization deacetylase AcuC-like enzyme